MIWIIIITKWVEHSYYHWTSGWINIIKSVSDTVSLFNVYYELKIVVGECASWIIKGNNVLLKLTLICWQGVGVFLRIQVCCWCWSACQRLGIVQVWSFKWKYVLYLKYVSFLKLQYKPINKQQTTCSLS